MVSCGAQVAQLVEHATENRSVGGSIPLSDIHIIYQIYQIYEIYIIILALVA